jgi:hypothetical protein
VRKSDCKRFSVFCPISMPLAVVLISTMTVIGHQQSTHSPLLLFCTQNSHLRPQSVRFRLLERGLLHRLLVSLHAVQSLVRKDSSPASPRSVRTATKPAPAGSASPNPAWPAFQADRHLADCVLALDRQS